MTVASGCNFAPNEANLRDDIRDSDMTPSEFALSVSSIHDRLDLSTAKGTAYDSFDVPHHSSLD